MSTQKKLPVTVEERDYIADMAAIVASGDSVKIMAAHDAAMQAIGTVGKSAELMQVKGIVHFSKAANLPGYLPGLPSYDSKSWDEKCKESAKHFIMAYRGNRAIAESSLNQYMKNYVAAARPAVYERIDEIVKSVGEAVESGVTDKHYQLFTAVASKVSTAFKSIGTKKPLPMPTTAAAIESATAKKKSGASTTKKQLTDAEMLDAAKSTFTAAVKTIFEYGVMDPAFVKAIQEAGKVLGIEVKAPTPVVVVAPTPKVETPAPVAAPAIDPAMLAAIKAALGL